MELTGNTILITGGATGTGWATAERLLDSGNEVLICGRREGKLREKQQQHPRLKTYVCDVAVASERIRLFETVTRDAPRLNVLINNAGIQRRTSLADAREPWEAHQGEIAINLEAPVHLSMLFIAHLQQQARPAIINVSSGLAFAPLALTPIYSATKAGLHSFTLSLRHQLAASAIEVIEVIPPAVNTDLGGVGLHDWGAPLDDFADAVMAGLAAGDLEIGFGTSERARRASRDELDAAFSRMNQS